MKKVRIFLAAALMSFATANGALATDLYPWRNHAAPFGFLFGNDIDTHQQTRQTPDGGLYGFFYVHFTGVVTRDRYRVATHADCNAVDCTVGWTLSGKPLMATFMYQVPPDHAVFLVDRRDIPQPGAFGHFHWFGNVMPSTGQSVSGQLLQLTAVDTFCFVHGDGQSASSRMSCRDNGGVNVNFGIDIATHLNIVTSRPPGL